MLIPGVQFLTPPRVVTGLSGYLSFSLSPLLNITCRKINLAIHNTILQTFLYLLKEDHLDLVKISVVMMLLCDFKNFDLQLSSVNRKVLV